MRAVQRGHPLTRVRIENNAFDPAMAERACHPLTRVRIETYCFRRSPRPIRVTRSRGCGLKRQLVAARMGTRRHPLTRVRIET